MVRSIEALAEDVAPARGGMNILFIGADTGTSKHRIDAIERCGHRVDVVNPLAMFGLNRVIQILIWRFGCRGLSILTHLYVRSKIGARSYDFCVVNHGETVWPLLVRFLKTRCGFVTCYNADNPFVARDGAKWRIMLRALPEYDSFCTPRMSSVKRAYGLGAKHVIRYVQTADEVVHQARPFDRKDSDLYRSEVALVSTWMPERGKFAARMIAAGVPLKIFGANWFKAPEYPEIADHIVLETFLGDEAYVRAIQYTRIAIGLVSEGNEDEHTHRSVEIPALGALLCAKRTPQHVELYEDGVEAVLWDDVEDCIAQCRGLLAEPERLAIIAKAGQAKAQRSGNWNEPLMRRVIAETVAAATRAKPDAAVAPELMSQ
ncbi:MAG TPA: glycosyltransferase [Roseiarcus sp.]